MAERSTDILVVDDDPWIVELVIMAAEERGWLVESAPDGAAGLAAIERRQPRLVLLDVRLPRQSGFLVLKEIARRYPDHPPVIMMTANQLDEDQAQAQGAVAILRKPFPVQRFLDLIGEHLGPARS